MKEKYNYTLVTGVHISGYARKKNLVMYLTRVVDRVLYSEILKCATRPK